MIGTVVRRDLTAAESAGELAGYRETAPSAEAIEIFATQRCQWCGAAAALPREFVNAAGSRRGFTTCLLCLEEREY